VLYTGLWRRRRRSTTRAIVTRWRRWRKVSMAVAFRASQADDQSVGQTWLELYLLKPAPEKIAPQRRRSTICWPAERRAFPRASANSVVVVRRAVHGAAGLVAHVRGHARCAVSRLHRQALVGNVDLLYDPQRHLYFRDVTFLHKTDERGNPIFCRAQWLGDGRHCAHPGLRAKGSTQPRKI